MRAWGNVGGTWGMTASVPNNKGSAAPGGGQCHPGPPFLPRPGFGQHPVIPSGWGSVQAPLPPAHFLLTSSHPALKTMTRPAPVPLTKPSLWVSPPTNCYSQTHLVPGTWLPPPPDPKTAQGDSWPLLSVSWSPTHLSHTVPVPSPPTCSFFLGSVHTAGPFTVLAGT